MSPEEELHEDAVRMLTTPQVFARGREYFRQGMVGQLVQRGNRLHAEVQGSDVEPYHVALTSEAGRISHAECTCPYEWGGLCKHAVAVLLAYFDNPEQVQEQPELAKTLARLDRDRLQAILLELAEREPGLTEQIEALALVVDSGAPRGPATPGELPPVDPEVVEQQIQAALRPARRGRRHDYYAAVEEAVRVLLETAERSRPYLEAGDGRAALVFLKAVAEYATTNIEDLLGDEGLEVGDLCGQLGNLLAEAFLTVELSPRERAEWAKQVGAWEARADNYGCEWGFAAARLAVKQGWDDPQLQRVLRGEVTPGDPSSPPGKGGPPSASRALAQVRLHFLERQGRWEEFLCLARAEGLTEQYVTTLVRLGRIPEAVEYGRSGLASRGEALTLTRALDAAGACEEALQVAEHALATLSAEPYAGGELPRWTRDLAARLGRKEQALRAALTVVRERATLADYLAVQSLAAERWPTLRDELLERVRGKQSSYPADEVDIFLHEGLLEEAMAAVDASPRHELVERVAEAALRSHPEWVFRACTRQFDRIADAGKSQYYREAVQWLERAKTALQAAGRQAEWRTYLDGAIACHGRKYSLRPMMERLR